MNVFAWIVRITSVTGSASVGRSGFHSTARLSSNTGEGHVAFAGGGASTAVAPASTTTARRTRAIRISDPHGDLLTRPEFQAVLQDVRNPHPGEPREEVPRVRDVHDGEARWRGRGRRHGGRRRGGPQLQGDRRRRRGRR